MTTDAARLIGTWRLLSQHTVQPDGTTTPDRGDHPLGVLMYDALGNMAVQLMRADADMTTPTDLALFETAMQTTHAYFGTYRVDEAAHTVHHDVVGAAYAPYRGTTQTRRVALDGDTLTLSTPPGADGRHRVLVWQRLHGPMA